MGVYKFVCVLVHSLELISNESSTLLEGVGTSVVGEARREGYSFDLLCKQVHLVEEEYNRRLLKPSRVTYLLVHQN